MMALNFAKENVQRINCKKLHKYNLEFFLIEYALNTTILHIYMHIYIYIYASYLIENQRKKDLSTINGMQL